MWNVGLDNLQAGVKIARRNINSYRYADDTTLMAESEEELNSLLMKVKEESEKAGLKLNVQKMQIMASSLIRSYFGSSLLFYHQSDIICISEVVDISPGNPESNLSFIQPHISYDVFCI